MRSHVGWGGEQNTLYKGVEPLQTRFKNLEGKLERESPKEQYLLAVGLGRYKWHQSQTPGDAPTRMLGPEGGGFGGGPTSIGEGNECQRERWAPKGGGL